MEPRGLWQELALAEQKVSGSIPFTVLGDLTLSIPAAGLSKDSGSTLKKTIQSQEQRYNTPYILIRSLIGDANFLPNDQ